MPVRKTAVAIPEELLREVDRAAKERGESRSRYVSRILRAAVRARRDAEVTRRLNALFANETVRTEQARAVRELDAQGVGWDDERW
jgi:metal-responsive CopG/Arc/MetJ family transcriptional regulator